MFVCKCVLYYCHRVSTQLQLTNISYHIVSYNTKVCEVIFEVLLRSRVFRDRKVCRKSNSRRSQEKYCFYVRTNDVITSSVCWRAYIWIRILSLQWLPGSPSMGAGWSGRETDPSPQTSTNVRREKTATPTDPHAPSWRGHTHTHTYIFRYKFNMPPFSTAIPRLTSDPTNEFFG